ncbi:hypothetical protein BKE38_12520 [Pseudoroseomonas deserti]|uniref:Uncharacterized protein n=1 Tax=Teichococcus deserti TaxID=1817963 RepID=A0A1V2H4E4_9PROT|nr:hypothetical protein [Pseudoroseomonas deserti]ONG53279.1 hypothetical protein BKE38_12520 [Pseudoroseomonas deserti]
MACLTPCPSPCSALGATDSAKLHKQIEQRQRTFMRLGPKLVVDMDQHEVACLIAEAILDLQRPAGSTPTQALAAFQPEDRTGFYRAAVAAIGYLAKKTHTAHRTF